MILRTLKPTLAMVLTLHMNEKGKIYWLAKRYAERYLSLWEEEVRPGERAVDVAARALNAQFITPFGRKLEWYDLSALGETEFEENKLEFFFLPRFLEFPDKDTSLLRNPHNTAKVSLKDLKSHLWKITPSARAAMDILPVDDMVKGLRALSKSTLHIVPSTAKEQAPDARS